MERVRPIWLALIVVAAPVLGTSEPDPNDEEAAFGPPGIERGQAPACESGGEASFAYQPIPAVDLPLTFQIRNWSATGLRACALRVDSGGDEPRRGFVVHGGPDASESAAFDVVFDSEGREFYVEIRDDTFVLDADEWLHEDHLEIWTAGERRRVESDDADEACMRQEGSPNHWAILLEDGEVVASDGNDAGAIDAEVADRRNGDGFGGIRVKGRLPAGAGPLVTVVYSDSDDGDEQERLIATSDLEHGDGTTLGELDTDSERRCELRNGELVPSSEPGDLPAEALAPVCGGADNVDGEHCSRCPDDTPLGKTEAENSETVQPVVEKEFEVDGRRALLVSWGGGDCTPRMMWGRQSRVLVVRDEETWRRAGSFETSASEYIECREIDVSSPGSTLLCESFHVERGVQTTSVFTLTAMPDSLEADRLLAVSSNALAECDPSSESVRLETIEEVGYDADTETVEIRASAVHVPFPDDYDGGICGDFVDDVDSSDGRTYDVDFSLEDGAFERPDEIEEDGELKEIPVHGL